VPVFDDNNAYFIDTSNADATTIYQIPLSGGTPTEIYSGPSTYSNGEDIDTMTYQLIGSTGSALIFDTNVAPDYEDLSPVELGTIYSIPVGKFSAKATIIGGPYNNENLTAFMALSKPNDYADSMVFATLVSIGGTGDILNYTYSSVAIPPAGPYGQTPTANSIYLVNGNSGSPIPGPFSPFVYQVQGITETDSGYGGGSFYQVTVANPPAATALASPGGTFTIPSTPAGGEYTGSFNGFLSGNVAWGNLSSSNGNNTTAFESTPSIVLLVDTSNNFLLPVSLPYTNIVTYCGAGETATAICE